MHIKHFTIMVKDFEKSIEFYETMTGLQIARRFKEGEAELAFLTNEEGATEIELVYTKEGQKFEGKGMFICFETDKLEELHDLAMNKGLNPSDIRNPGNDTSYFYVYDPNGVSVQFRVFPKQSE